MPDLRRALPALLLALSLALSGCAGQMPKALQESPGLTADLTAEPEPQPVYEVLLPAGSLRVEGAYPVLPAPERYEPGLVLELTASNSYGAVYPYVGAYSYDTYYGYYGGPIYGVCDAAGKIICDPVYHSASVITDGQHALYLLEQWYGYDYDDFGPKVEGRYTLATPDGRWVEQYDEIILTTRAASEQSNMQVSGALDLRDLPYITVCRDGLWGLLDYTGRQIFPCQYPTPVYCTEGYALLILDNPQEYWFVDLEGNPRFGPFQRPDMVSYLFTGAGEAFDFTTLDGMFFVDGLARIYQDGLFGYIDREGRVVAEPQYARASLFAEGHAAVSGEGYGIIDSAGRPVAEFEWSAYTSWSTAIQDGTTREFGDGYSYRYVDDGFLVTRGVASQHLPGEEIRYWGDGLFVLLQDKAVVVRDFAGDLILEHPSDWQSWYNMELTEGFLAVYFSTWGPFKTLNFITYYTVYDKQGRQLHDRTFELFAPFGDCYCVRQGAYGGLLDGEGRWLLQVSLLDSLAD